MLSNKTTTSLYLKTAIKKSFNSFNELLLNYTWQEVSEHLKNITIKDVEISLAKEKKDEIDFINLISEKALPYLEIMAQMSHAKTVERFGRVIQFYIPMYLSNECNNQCTYCGFSVENKIPRKTLNNEEIEKEIKIIKAMGHDHLLLLTGESNLNVGIEYFKKVIPIIKPHFSHLAMEVQPMQTQEYEILRDMGVDSIVVYQETYRKETYRDYHPRGKKSNFEYRIDTPERANQASIRKIGLGVLLGLEDWRVDSFMTCLHFFYLKKNHWKTKYSISLPRIRPAESGFDEKNHISNRQFVQLICAWRLMDEDIEINLSTRESASFRDHLFRLGITSMSVGSNTSPGGHQNDNQELEQFEIDDTRHPSELKKVLNQNYYQVVWKDWDHSFS